MTLSQGQAHHVRSYVLFTLGFLRGEQWAKYFDTYAKTTSDPLKDVSPWLRQLLLRIPFTSVPTVLLFVGVYIFMGYTIYLSETQQLALTSAIFMLILSMFVMFTVAHEAAHGSISANQVINGGIGRFAFATLGPTAVFAGWRILHLLHHKHTNDVDRDPDRYACEGPRILLPLRWFSTIFHYKFYWLSLTDQPNAVPLREKIEVVIHLSLNLALTMLSLDFNFFHYLFYYWMIPSFVANGSLIFAFDFLPHYKHSVTPVQNRYKTTSILQTYSPLQPLFTLLFQYQNYHLLHHLYPTIPFYHYIDQWEAKKQSLLQKDIIFQQMKF